MYDPEQLRTFLAVAESLSFTQAAARLEIGQPTVSQHVRKLESSVGRQLFVRDTHTVRLTADGDALAGFARGILAAHQRAETYFSGSGLAGRLRFGVADDLALTPLPRILRDFRRLYPRIDLELTVAQSAGLERRAESGHLDVAFIKRETGVTHGQLVRRDRLAWVAVEDAHVDPSRALPLVVYQAPSVTRSLGIQALERVGRSYRITCTIRGVNGLLAATRAGLGVAIFAQSLTPDDLVELPAEAQLPELGDLDLVLLTGPRAPTEAANALTTAIMSRAWVRTRTGA